MAIVRKITALAVCLFILLSMTTVSAAVSHLSDGAGLLTDSEAVSLESTLDELSVKYGMDIAVVTVYGIDNGMSPMEYADNFLESNYCDINNDVNGVLLFIDMKERDWHISTCGSAIANITDYGLEYIEDRMISDLSGGYYYDSFTAFAFACDTLLDYAARNGHPYDRTQYGGNRSVTKTDPKDSVFSNLLISVTFGFIVGIVTVTFMKSQLKSVGAQMGARNYIRQGSFNLTRSNDIYLYRKVNKTRRVENTSGGTHRSGGSTTHTSSSGRSFGGRGGKF